ncbi:MAG TPA: hypothetical protein VJT09_14920 [Pyrinomonadaceae bacterium]|nr:hypothetical protein [Pyrinomonadaceae bacterium]
MKTLQRLCAASVLTLALALSAFAGNMSTTVVSPPPPESQATTQGDISTSVTGTISTGITGTMTTGITGQIETGFADPMTETFLNLLQNLLALF